ncbi:MAG TPA: 3-deoxy-8-phosphooctulonate synthase [Candidatus Omnitrophota bacterium]|nr:3-deoxy-8-phosphooctulonate synthase [Candidatus Omnitrophota bacterium]
MGLKVREVNIGKVILGGKRPIVLIAGPCVIENQTSTLEHADAIKSICKKLSISFVFKSSYDKANRSSIKSFRGLGIRNGLKVLSKIKKELSVPVLSDVHSAEDARIAGEVLDCIQIPAFLSRQTDILVAAAKTGKAVNVKKGQFMAPWNMEEAAKKIESQGNKNILFTERGVSFGYNNLVVDFRGLAIMREMGYPVIFDATHSVQLPGARGTSSGGERQHVAGLSRAASAIGVDALFLEVHKDPDHAPCDGPNMINLRELEGLLKVIIEIDKTVLKNNLR